MNSVTKGGGAAVNKPALVVLWCSGYHVHRTGYCGSIQQQDCHLDPALIQDLDWSPLPLELNAVDRVQTGVQDQTDLYLLLS